MHLLMRTQVLFFPVKSWEVEGLCTSNNDNNLARSSGKSFCSLMHYGTHYGRVGASLLRHEPIM